MTQEIQFQGFYHPAHETDDYKDISITKDTETSSDDNSTDGSSDNTNNNQSDEKAVNEGNPT